MGHRIGRLWLALVAGCALAAFACSHPGGSSHPSGGAGTTGSGGNVSPAGSAGTGGDTGTPGTAGTTGVAGDSGVAGSGSAGTTGAAGDGAAGTTGAAGNGSGSAGNGGSTGAAGNGNAGTTGSGGAAGGATGAGGTGTDSNLITNGDFSGGATNWHTENGTGSVNASGAYCVTNPGSALIGWQSTPGTPLMLSMGSSYRFSYQASGSGTVNAKVALAVTPYTADFQGSDGLNSSLQTFTHTFTSPNNDINTGLAFTFSNAGTGTVCIDNVTLVAN